MRKLWEFYFPYLPSLVNMPNVGMVAAFNGMLLNVSLESVEMSLLKVKMPPVAF